MSYGYATPKIKKFQCIETWEVLKVKVGETLYEFTLFDYGATIDDEAILQEPCIALTFSEDGGYPFIILPKRCVKELT